MVDIGDEYRGYSNQSGIHETASASSSPCSSVICSKASLIAASISSTTSAGRKTSTRGPACPGCLGRFIRLRCCVCALNSAAYWSSKSCCMKCVLLVGHQHATDNLSQTEAHWFVSVQRRGCQNGCQLVRRL